MSTITLPKKYPQNIQPQQRVSGPRSTNSGSRCRVKNSHVDIPAGTGAWALKPCEGGGSQTLVPAQAETSTWLFLAHSMSLSQSTRALRLADMEFFAG